MCKVVSFYEDNRNKDSLLREYYYCLSFQYLNAIGKTTNDIDISSKPFNTELLDWLSVRDESKSLFKYNLCYMGIGYDFSFTAELNKGVRDTVVSEYMDTFIVSPYAFTFKDSRKGLFNGKIRLVDENSNVNSCNPNNYSFMSYLVHNPYYNFSVDSIMNLYYLCGYQIVFGVYGKVYDKDMEKKKQMLLGVKNILMDCCTDSYIERNDDYCYVVASDYTRCKKI